MTYGELSHKGKNKLAFNLSKGTPLIASEIKGVLKDHYKIEGVGEYIHISIFDLKEFLSDLNKFL